MTDFSKIRSRYDRVRFITGIGGYSDRYDVWPIELNVSAASAKLDADTMWSRYVDGDYFPVDVKKNPEDAAELKSIFMSVYNAKENSLWEMGQESACNMLRESDAYVYMPDGKTEAKVEFQLRGRCGKHLVLDTLCGVRLEGMNADDLYDELTAWSSGSLEGRGVNKPRSAEWDVPTETVNDMFRYLTQAVEWFTPGSAAGEVENGADFHLAMMVNDAWEEYQAIRASEEAKQSMASRIADSLREAGMAEVENDFLSFCKMVNVVCE